MAKMARSLWEAPHVEGFVIKGTVTDAQPGGGTEDEVPKVPSTAALSLRS